MSVTHIEKFAVIKFAASQRPYTQVVSGYVKPQPSLIDSYFSKLKGPEDLPLDALDQLEAKYRQGVRGPRPDPWVGSHVQRAQESIANISTIDDIPITAQQKVLEEARLKDEAWLKHRDQLFNEHKKHLQNIQTAAGGLASKGKIPELARVTTSGPADAVFQSVDPSKIIRRVPKGRFGAIKGLAGMMGNLFKGRK